MGRPEKYDWEDKREICAKLYDENKTTAQIVDFFSQKLHVPPSELPTPKQFNHRFKLWGFPPRRSGLEPEQEARLVERMRELFSQNVMVQEMQDMLNAEGWEMDNYKFNKYRKKYGLVKRCVAGATPYDMSFKRKRAGEDDGDGDNEVMELGKEGPPAADSGTQRQVPLPLSAEEAARRAQRLAEVQAESDQLMQARKRRRRIRGYGFMGPDAPGTAPRFNSETSLDESKAYLHLTNELYVQLRKEFEAICEAEGIIKPSECVDGQWQAAKDKLVRESVHLSSILHPLQPDLEKKTIALQCICIDVCKKKRSASSALTMADANNILGLDPLQSKELRRKFYEILETNHFTTVAALGREGLEELRQQWYAQSELLTQVVAEKDPLKLRALLILDRDCRKRFADNPVKNPARAQSSVSYGPGPGPSRRSRSTPKTSGENPSTKTDVPPAASTTPATTRANAFRQRYGASGPSWNGQTAPSFHQSTIADMVPPINFDLDPALQSFSSVRQGPLWPPPASGGAEGLALLGDLSSFEQPQGNGAVSDAATTNVSIPAYFRLSPDSNIIGNHPKLWLGKLNVSTFDALKTAATARTCPARVAKVHGVVKNADQSEDKWLIENDNELMVYLEEAGEKATFVVQLEGGYA